MHIDAVSISPITISARGASEKTATLIDTEGLALKKDLSLSGNSRNFDSSSIENYQTQLRNQGEQEQALVVTKGERIVATIGRNGTAMFQDSAIAQIWDGIDGDIEAFVTALNDAGYNSTLYEQGTGPTYAEIHQQIHGESYTTLIKRQTIEFAQEQALSAGSQSYFSITA